MTDFVIELLATLAEKKPKLAVSVVAVFICNEEDSSVPGLKEE